MSLLRSVEMANNSESKASSDSSTDDENDDAGIGKSIQNIKTNSEKYSEIYTHLMIVSQSLIKHAELLANQEGGGKNDLEESSDDDDETDEEQTQQENESSMINRHWGMIEDHTYVTKTNQNHVYVNFNLLGQELSTKIVMEHFRTILKNYAAPKTHIFINPQLGFFLYNQAGNAIVKYWYASANTALFPDYRLLSTKTLKRLEFELNKLYLLNWPFHVKMQGAEKSDLAAIGCVNKRQILMDFDGVMCGVHEKITTSLFCCIVKYLDGEVGSLTRKHSLLLDRALDSMIAASTDLMALDPKSPRVFGVLLPTVDNFEILSKLEKYYKIGIRIRNDDGFEVRSPGQNALNTQKWEFHFYDNTMNVVYTLKGNQRYILILNEDAYFEHNRCEYCNKLYESHRELSQHVNRYGCASKKHLDETGALPDLNDSEIGVRYVCKQGIWRPKMNIIQKLKEMNILLFPDHEKPDSVLYCKLFCVFDIESFLQGMNEKEAGNTPHYKFSNEHKAAMVAYTNSFNWETKVFISDPKEPSLFVRQFVESLLECQRMMSNELRHKIQIYFDEIERRIIYEKREYWLNRYNALLKTLTTYVETIPVLGWNSSKYDIPVLRTMGFFYYLNQLDGPVGALKKTGSRYLSVNSKHLVFLDWICFQGSKLALRDYLTKFQNSTIQGSMEKEYFPYSCLVSHESLNQPLPTMDQFWDDLHRRNQLASPEWLKYKKLCKKHNQQVVLAKLKLDKPPESPQQKYQKVRKYWISNGFKTVLDILISYIKADCLPLAKAILQSLTLYHSYNIDILRDYVSLPSFVLHLAVNFIPNKKDCFFVLLQLEEREMLQKCLLGGPSLIFTRHVEVGKSRLRPHDYSHSPIAKKIIGFDQNNQYGGALKQDAFVGHYAVRLAENKFDPKLMGAKRHNEILYVEYFAYKNDIQNSRHVASSHGIGQKWIKISSGLIQVDGYCSVPRSNGTWRQIVLEYHEEGYSHGWCEKCQTPDRNAAVFHPTGKTMLQQYIKTMERMEEIKKAGYELHYVWQCQFEHIKHQQDFQFFEQYHFNLGPFISQRLLTEAEALFQIFTGEINGFVELSCKVDEKDRGHFCDFPAIFKHLEIDRTMLFEPMLSYAKRHDLLQHKQKLLVSSFHADDVVFSTTYIRFLQGLGIDFFNVKKIVQFRSEPCLAPYIDKFTENRLRGDTTNNPLLSEWSKSAINNSFGYSIMNQKKRTITKYRSRKEFRKILMNQSPVIEMFEAGLPDNPNELIEVTTRPKKVVYNTPVQIGSEVLARGKVELLKFVYEIIKPHLKPDHYEFLLTDTDSVYMAIGGESLTECLKDGHMTEWKRIEYERFVDESTEARKLATKRTPLYWHVERESKGTLIALSSKLYILTDEFDQEIKASAKGIQKQKNVTLVNKPLFESLLHDKELDELPLVVNTGFMQKNEKMKTYTLRKHSLHACYVKRVVRKCNKHTYTYPDY